jgi:hypothetical protein
MSNTKAGLASAGAMRALHPDDDPYTRVQVALDKALAAPDPGRIAETVRTVQLQLASIAASSKFDARRHRAISQALRGLSVPSAPPTPLTTRKA